MELAAAGATTVVGLMATDAWGASRLRVAALLRGEVPGSGAEHDAVGDALEWEHAEAADAWMAGDLAVLSDLEAIWRTRLRRLLAVAPATAVSLRALVADYAGHGLAGSTTPCQAAGSAKGTSGQGAPEGECSI